jgi:hypothetical protein
MKEEIALIIAENIEFTSEFIDGDEIFRAHPDVRKMNKALQKLFLSKQVELLNDLYDAPNRHGAIFEKRNRIESELKELQ